MQWPWVRRSELSKWSLRYAEVHGKLRDVRRSRREYRDRALRAEAALDALQSQLARSENERTDLQLKLLRAGFGVNPFAEMFVPQSGQQAQAESTSPALPTNASAEQVRAYYVREGAEKYGNNLAKITRHVELREKQFYAHRDKPPVLSDHELAAAAKVQADMEAAIAEGAAEAAKETA